MNAFLSHESAETAAVKIVLVEDDDADAKAVRRAFQAARISNEIVRVVDGVEALELLRKHREKLPIQPFILLVDVNMPRMNGHELVAALREDPQLSRLVVFMLTTSNAQSDLDAAYGNHVAGYILKEHAGRDFLKLADTLAGYWRLVELPVAQ